MCIALCRNRDRATTAYRALAAVSPKDQTAEESLIDLLTNMRHLADACAIDYAAADAHAAAHYLAEIAEPQWDSINDDLAGIPEDGPATMPCPQCHHLLGGMLDGRGICDGCGWMIE
jgi:hypothetical protein